MAGAGNMPAHPVAVKLIVSPPMPSSFATLPSHLGGIGLWLGQCVFAPWMVLPSHENENENPARLYLPCPRYEKRRAGRERF